MWFISDFWGHNFSFVFKIHLKGCLVSYIFLHVKTIFSFHVNQRAQYIWKCWMMSEFLWYKRESGGFLPVCIFYIYLLNNYTEVYLHIYLQLPLVGLSQIARNIHLLKSDLGWKGVLFGLNLVKTHLIVI